MSLSESISYIFNRPLLNEEIRITSGNGRSKFSWKRGGKGSKDLSPDKIANTGKVSDTNVVKAGTPDELHLVLDKLQNDQDFKNNISASLLGALSGISIPYKPTKLYPANAGLASKYADSEFVQGFSTNPINTVKRTLNNFLTLLFSGARITKEVGGKNIKYKTPPVLSSELSAKEFVNIIKALREYKTTYSQYFGTRMDFANAKANPLFDKFNVDKNLISFSPKKAAENIEAVQENPDKVVSDLWTYAIHGAAMVAIKTWIMNYFHDSEDRNRMLKAIYKYDPSETDKIDYKFLDKIDKRNQSQIAYSMMHHESVSFGKNEKLLLEGLELGQFDDDDNDNNHIFSLAGHDDESNAQTVNLADDSDSETTDNETVDNETVDASDADDSSSEATNNETVEDPEASEIVDIEKLLASEANAELIDKVYYTGKNLPVFDINELWFAPLSLCRNSLSKESITDSFYVAIQAAIENINSVEDISSKNKFISCLIRYKNKKAPFDIRNLVNFVQTICTDSNQKITIEGRTDIYVLLPGGLNHLYKVATPLLTITMAKSNKYVTFAKDKFHTIYLSTLVDNAINKIDESDDDEYDDEFSAQGLAIPEIFENTIKECERSNPEHKFFHDTIGRRAAALLSYLQRDAYIDKDPSLSWESPRISLNAFKKLFKPIDIGNISGFKQYLKNGVKLSVYKTDKNNNSKLIREVGKYRESIIDKLQKRYNITVDDLFVNVSSYQDLYDKLANLEFDFARKNPENSDFIRNVLSRTRSKLNLDKMSGRSRRSMGSIDRQIMKLFSKIIDLNPNKANNCLQKYYTDLEKSGIEVNKDFIRDCLLSDKIFDPSNVQNVPGIQNEVEHYVCKKLDTLASTNVDELGRLISDAKDIFTIETETGKVYYQSYSELSNENKKLAYKILISHMVPEERDKIYKTAYNRITDIIKEAAAYVASCIYYPYCAVVQSIDENKTIKGSADPVNKDNPINNKIRLAAGEKTAFYTKVEKTFNRICTWLGQNGFDNDNVFRQNLYKAFINLYKKATSSKINIGLAEFTDELKGYYGKSSAVRNKANETSMSNTFYLSLIKRVQNIINKGLTNVNRSTRQRALKDLLDELAQVKTEEEVKMIVDSIDIPDIDNTNDEQTRYELIASKLGGDLLFPAILKQSMVFKTGTSSTSPVKCVEFSDKLGGLLGFIKHYIPGLFDESMKTLAEDNDAKPAIKARMENPALTDTAKNLCNQILKKNPDKIIPIKKLKIFSGSTAPEWAAKCAIKVEDITDENGNTRAAFTPVYRVRVWIASNAFTSSKLNLEQSRLFSLTENFQGSYVKFLDLGYLTTQDYKALHKSYKEAGHTLLDYLLATSTTERLTSLLETFIKSNIDNSFSETSDEEVIKYCINNLKKTYDKGPLYTNFISPLINKINYSINQHLLQVISRFTSTRKFNLKFVDSDKVEKDKLEFNTFKAEHDKALDSIDKEEIERYKNFEEILSDLWPRTTYHIKFKLKKILSDNFSNNSILFGILPNSEWIEKQEANEIGSAYNSLGKTGEFETIATQKFIYHSADEENKIKEGQRTMLNTFAENFNNNLLKKTGEYHRTKVSLSEMVQDANGYYNFTCSFIPKFISPSTTNYFIFNTDKNKKAEVTLSENETQLAKMLFNCMLQCLTQKGIRVKDLTFENSCDLDIRGSFGDIIDVSKSPINDVEKHLKDLIQVYEDYQALRDNTDNRNKIAELKKKIDFLDENEPWTWVNDQVGSREISEKTYKEYLKATTKIKNNENLLSREKILESPYMAEVLELFTSYTWRNKLNTAYFYKYIDDYCKNLAQSDIADEKNQALISTAQRQAALIFTVAHYKIKQYIAEQLKNLKIYWAIDINPGTVAMMLHRIAIGKARYLAKGIKDDIMATDGTPGTSFIGDCTVKLCAALIGYINQFISTYESRNVLRGNNEKMATLILNYINSPDLLENIIESKVKKEDLDNFITNSIEDGILYDNDEDSEESSFIQSIANSMSYDQFGMKQPRYTQQNSKKSNTNNYKRQYMINDWKRENFWNNYGK